MNAGRILNKRPGHGQLCPVLHFNGEEMWIQKIEEDSFGSCFLAHELRTWSDVTSKIEPALEYIEDRLIYQCNEPYHMRMQHSQPHMLRVFDPAIACEMSVNALNASFVQGLAIIASFKELDFIPG